MTVPTDLDSLSTTANSNPPAGSEQIAPELDNHIRQLYAHVATVRDRDAGKVTAATLAATTGAAGVGANDGASGTLWTTVAGFIAKIISSAGSSVIGFIQAGTGAVLRTVQSKLRESPVSLADFGCDTTGATACDTQASNAVTAALAGAGRLIVNANSTFSFSNDFVFPSGIDVIFQSGAKVKPNGNTITFNGGVDVAISDIKSGSGNFVTQDSRKTFMSHLMVRPQDDSIITTQDEVLAMADFCVIDNKPKIVSTSSVVAGTGSKSFVISKGSLSNAWLASLGTGTPFVIYSQSLGTETQQYLFGAATGWNAGTSTLTINVTTNSLPAGTYSDWIFCTDFPAICFANYSGSDNLQSSGGILGWVGNTSDTPPPYSYLLSLYGGSGTIPVIYAKPNGKTGLGTEEPNERMHLVGNPAGTIGGNLKQTRSLTVEHDYKQSFETDSSAWGGNSFVKIATVRPSAADEARYPGISYPVHEYYRGRKVYDVYKILNQGATFQNTMAITTVSDSAACLIEVKLAGKTTGQGSWALDAKLVGTRAGGVLSVTVISKTVYGYGSGFATPPDIQWATFGTDFVIRLRGGMDSANTSPLTRDVYGVIEVYGAPTVSGGNITVTMS